jgi:hypothetical protein
MECSAGRLRLLLLLLFNPHYVIYGCLAGFQKSAGLTEQIRLIHFSAKSFLTTRMN